MDLLGLVITQAVVGVMAVVKLYFDVQEMKKEIKVLQEEKKAILDKLTEMSEALAVIKSHFELGTLKGIKTHSR